MIVQPSNLHTPEIYFCDMSRQLMRDPVISVHGYTFERGAIAKWLALGNNFCPCSGKDLAVHDLIVARNLKEEIQTWRAENGLPSDKIIGMILITGADHNQDRHDQEGLCLDDNRNEKMPVEDVSISNRRIPLSPWKRIVHKAFGVLPRAA